jgi:3-methyl-2-oxobutanoate hydroxymethyltransferase
MVNAAIGYAASFLDKEGSYANVARTAFEALTALADDVRSARQIRY